MMFYARFLIVSFLLSFLFASVVSAPIGRGSAVEYAIDPATAQPLSDQQIPVIETSVDADAAGEPAVIHEETHAFDWAPKSSKPSIQQLGAFHEIVRIFLQPSTHRATPQQGHQRRRRLSRWHP